MFANNVTIIPQPNYCYIRIELGIVKIFPVRRTANESFLMVIGSLFFDT
jgi:hypothetical protein